MKILNNLFIIISACFFSFVTYEEDRWLECDKIYITKHSPVQEQMILWMNTASQSSYPVKNIKPAPYYASDWGYLDEWMERYGWAGKPYPDNKWITVSVADRVPEGTKAIYLTGLLLITHGYVDEIGGLTIAFRRKGETENYRYNHQTCEAHIGGGARSPMSVWVPLDENREFEFKWTRSTPEPHPQHCCYGINLVLNAFAK